MRCAPRALVPMGAPKAPATPAAQPAVMKSRWSHLLRKRLKGQSTVPALVSAFSAASRNLLGGMSVKLTVPCDTRPPSVAPRKIMGPSGPTGRPAPTQQAQDMNLMAEVFHSNIWSAAHA
jgi:hypothetical protein